MSRSRLVPRLSGGGRQGHAQPESAPVDVDRVPRPGPAPRAGPDGRDIVPELRDILKNGQTVVVTDSSGQRIRGKVGDISPSSLLLVMPDERRSSILRRGRTIPVTMSEAAVSEVRRAKAGKQMARIGAGVGAGLAILGRVAPNEPEKRAPVMVLGSATLIIGGYDAMVNSCGTRLSRSPPGTVTLPITPLAGRDR